MENRKVLFAEDEDAIREFYVARVLKPILEGRQIEVVTRGEELEAAVLSHLNSPCFDLIITDNNLLSSPTGLEVIRKYATQPTAPRFILQYGGQEYVQEMAQEAGAYAVLRKPFQPSELSRTVKTAIGSLTLSPEEKSYFEKIYSSVQGQFPKQCPGCNTLFNNELDYNNSTFSFGLPKPTLDFGVMFERSCLNCKRTKNLQTVLGLKIDSNKIGMDTQAKLIAYVLERSQKNHIPFERELDHVRREYNLFLEQKEQAH